MIQLARIPSPVAVRIGCPVCLGWGIVGRLVCEVCEGEGKRADMTTPRVMAGARPDGTSETEGQ